MTGAGVFIFFLCTGLVLASKDLPPGSPRCRRNDPNLEKCMLAATEAFRPFIISGVRSLGVPSMDPLIIPEIYLKQGTESINIKANATQVHVKGLSNYKFSSMKVSFTENTFITKGVINHLDLEGDIQLDGKILVAPLSGSGTFASTVEKTTVYGYQKFDIIRKKGVEFIHFTNSSIKVDLDKPTIRFTGLFGDDDNAIGQATTKLINENTEILTEDLKPALEGVINKLIKSLLFSTIIEQIPFDKLFPVD